MYEIGDVPLSRAKAPMNKRAQPPANQVFLRFIISKKNLTLQQITVPLSGKDANTPKHQHGNI